MVLARTARLSPSGRTVIDAVAIASPRTEQWLLEALVSEEASGLDECVRSGMLTYSRDGVESATKHARLAVEGSIEPRRLGPASTGAHLRPCGRRPTGTWI